MHVKSVLAVGVVGDWGGRKIQLPGNASREKISRLHDCRLPVVQSTLRMTVHACQSQSSDFPRLATGIRLPPVLTLLCCGARSQVVVRGQGSETTDPASRTVCPTPAWPRLHAQAQNEATLRLPTADWLATGIPCQLPPTTA
eukprot:scaffold18013_cov48-Cyclotella_meneghiniana.AAC.1